MGLQNSKEFKQEIAKMQRQYEKDDTTREKIISLARIALKPAKQAIYAAHRDDIKAADKLLTQAKNAINTAKKELEASGLQDVGMLNASIEEYIEGVCYVSFVKNNTLPSPNQLGLAFSPKNETYLQAICDCAGELSRRAVVAATKNETAVITTIYETLNELLETFMEFDFRSSELRKKTENLKYSLNKVEGILYDIKVKAR
ncbi:hypothetical protein K9M74_03415 [Candidatus Woesearchaeota archaeon]|nr:hypothetical protein [Candidatus Woesearchaeota archaeon]